MAENSLKRPHPDDELQNGDSVQKKIRSNNTSPVPQPNGNASTKADVSRIMADARARAAAVAAKLRGTGVASPGPTPTAKPSSMSRAEELRARVAAAIGNKGPTAQRTSSPANVLSPPPLDDGMMGARGGLGTALHPALMDNTGQGTGSSKNKQAIQSKFPTTMANRVPSPANQMKSKTKKQLDLSGPSAEETRASPYFDASLGAQTATLKARNARQLKFNEKGKYIQQATALRRAANLEAMRKRIQESSKRVLPSEDPGEKNFLIEAPPEIEWWDEGLLSDPKEGYVDVETDNKVCTEDSIVTRFIQNPVQIEPPGEKLMPAPKPMFLTAKEQAKLRRQTRMANLKEIQTKQRLGLLPTPEPKVKLKNMMLVRGEEAVKDPTAVEARVRAEVAARQSAHEQMNEDRKLTKEERHEKVELKKEQDLAKGVYCVVYRVSDLSNGKNQFKVRKNAEQNSLTGLVLYGKQFSLLLAEGSAHSIRAYKKLMEQRIQWTENDQPNKPPRENGRKNPEDVEWLSNVDSAGNLKDLSTNKCQLIFEGQQKDRVFRKWTTKVAETSKDAMDILSRSKMENFWTMAQNMS